MPASGHWARLNRLCAGVPGLEPRLTEPESVGLPITPYPKGVDPSSTADRADDKLYRTVPSASKTRSLTRAAGGVGGRRGCVDPLLVGRPAGRAERVEHDVVGPG